MANEGQVSSRCTRSKKIGRDLGEGSWTQLSESDVKLVRHPTVTTLTFFDGDAPVQLLRQRTEAILDANPWLAGRLKSNAPNGIPGLWVSNMPDKSAHFCELSNEELRPGMSMAESIAATDGQTVKKGVQCLDKDEPLFKVIVVLTTPGKFAVVVSMSHVIADGCTYYALWNALGGAVDASVPSLNPERNPEFDAAVKDALGESKVNWMESGSMKLMFIRNLIRNKFKGKPLELHAWYVNEDFVEAQKKVAKEAGDVPFVSANDILTSWFAKRNKCDYAMMAINFRDRLLDLSASHAGNYESVVAYWPDEFETPAGVRKALTTPKSFKAGREDVPSFCQTYKASLGMTTNWSGFAKELALPDCTQTLHLPLFETMGVIQAMIIFRPTPDKLAFMIADRKGDMMSELDNSAMGEQIF